MQPPSARQAPPPPPALTPAPPCVPTPQAMPSRRPPRSSTCRSTASRRSRTPGVPLESVPSPMRAMGHAFGVFVCMACMCVQHLMKKYTNTLCMSTRRALRMSQRPSEPGRGRSIRAVRGEAYATESRRRSCDTRSSSWPTRRTTELLAAARTYRAHDRLSSRAGAATRHA